MRRDLIALCGPCNHYADPKLLERGCECKCHAGVAVFPRTWVVPNGNYKFHTTNVEKRLRREFGAVGAKAAKQFRKARRGA